MYFLHAFYPIVNSPLPTYVDELGYARSVYIHFKKILWFITSGTVFEIIDGAQIILKSQNEAIAHDQWSASWFTRVRLYEKLKFVLFGCVTCKGK